MRKKWKREIANSKKEHKRLERRVGYLTLVVSSAILAHLRGDDRRFQIPLLLSMTALAIDLMVDFIHDEEKPLSRSCFCKQKKT